MKIVECAQKSKTWWDARRGIPSASEFDSIITPKTLKASASQDRYICKLIAEKYANIWPSEEGYISPDMANGVECEPLARAAYEFEHDCEVTQVGFCISDNGLYGCSPDGLVGDEGGLEIKCPKMETHAGYLLDGVLPSDYRCQVHGELLVTGRKWFDFVSYCEGMPTFEIRVYPDDFTVALKREVELFCDRYAKALETIQAKWR